MSDQELQPRLASDHASTNPLLAELSPDQITMLRTIMMPATLPEASDVQNWPKWDYVSRSLARSHPALDGNQILQSLPSIRGQTSDALRYGLVWRSDGRGSVAPRSAETVGLTICGLLSLKRHLGNAESFADEVAFFVARRIAREEEIEPTPWEVVSSEHDLRAVGDDILAPRPGRSFKLAGSTVGEVLLHEYFPLAARTTNFNYDLNVHQSHFGYLRGVADADDYAAAVWKHARVQREEVIHYSALPLVQTLDYLGYVLQTEWNQPERMTSAPDLQSAAALALPVTNAAEFESRLSGLWNILSNLNVLRATDIEITNRGWNPKTSGSLNHLQLWLEFRLGDRYAVRAAKAISEIRAVRRIRTESQHRSRETIADAVEARRLLGLEEFVADWASAWQMVLARIAGAFDVIREEVQGAAAV